MSKSLSLFVAERTVYNPVPVTGPDGGPSHSMKVERERVYVQARSMAEACMAMNNKDGIDPATIRRATLNEQRILRAVRGGNFLEG